MFKHIKPIEHHQYTNIILQVSITSILPNHMEVMFLPNHMEASLELIDHHSGDILGKYY